MDVALSIFIVLPKVYCDTLIGSPFAAVTKPEDRCGVYAHKPRIRISNLENGLKNVTSMFRRRAWSVEPNAQAFCENVKGNETSDWIFKSLKIPS